jgi:hypothetical protein
MDTILTRAADLPATQSPQRQEDAGKTLLRWLSAVAHRVAERLTSPPRDVPVEYYRFPPF